MSAEDVVAKLSGLAHQAVAQQMILESIPPAMAGGEAMMQVTGDDDRLFHIAACRLLASSAAALAASKIATWEEVEKTTLSIVRGFLRDMRRAHDASR